MENNLNDRLRDIFNLGGGEAHAQRIESRLTGSGIPDWNYCVKGVDGWIEAKYIAEWPKRKDTTVRLTKYTAEQRLWLWERDRAGGRAFLVVQVGNEYFIFDAITAQEIGKKAKEFWYKQCLGNWKRTINKKELLQILCK